MSEKDVWFEAEVLTFEFPDNYVVRYTDDKYD